jgi:hypothetical protein
MKDYVWKIGVLSLMTSILFVVLGIAVSVRKLPSRIVNEGIDTYKMRQEEWAKDYDRMQAEAQKTFGEMGDHSRSIPSLPIMERLSDEHPNGG